MKTLLALYKTPAYPDKFMAYYNTTHLPLVRKVPGLVSADVIHVDRTLMGEQDWFLIAEMRFADADSFRAAMKSPENAAVGADLANFADGLVTVLIGSTDES